MTVRDGAVRSGGWSGKKRAPIWWIFDFFEAREVAGEGRTLAAGCSTSRSLRIVAPSLVMVTSPMSSTSILSRPTGPREVFTMFATA